MQQDSNPRPPELILSKASINPQDQGVLAKSYQQQAVKIFEPIKVFYESTKDGVIIKCPLNGLSHNLHDVIITSQMAISKISLMMAVN